MRSTSKDDLHEVVRLLHRDPASGGCPYTNSLSARLLLVSISKDFAGIDETLEAVSKEAASHEQPSREMLQTKLGDLLFDSLMLLHVCAREHAVDTESVWANAVERIKQRTPYIAEWGDPAAVAATARALYIDPAAAAIDPTRRYSSGTISPASSGMLSPLSPSSPRVPSASSGGTNASASMARASQPILAFAEQRSPLPERDGSGDLGSPLSPLSMQAEALHWDSRCTIIAASAKTIVHVQVPGAWGHSPQTDAYTGEKKRQIYALSWTFSCMNSIRFRLVLVNKGKGPDVEVITPCIFTGGR